MASSGAALTKRHVAARNLCLGLVLGRDECRQERSAVLRTCRGVRVTARTRSRWWAKFLSSRTPEEQAAFEHFAWDSTDSEGVEDAPSRGWDIDSTEKALQVMWGAFLLWRDRRSRRRQQQLILRQAECAGEMCSDDRHLAASLRFAGSTPMC